MQDIKITIIQSNLHWENIDKNLEMFFDKISNISEQTDLIVLPEMFNTGFTMNAKKLAEKADGKTIRWMSKHAKEKNCVITGSLIVEESGNYFNRLVWMKPDGSHHTYDKRHLFRLANEQNYYSSGNKRLIVELKGWRICPLVCYDLRFPVWSRNKKLAVDLQPTTNNQQLTTNYDLLIYVANWPERRIHPWKTLLLARAIENQCYVVGLNRIGNDGNNVYHSGDSAVVNPKGEIISKTKTDKESIETVNLSYKDLEDFRKSFPVGLDGDNFEIISD